jgi:hypothetical protein
MKKPTLKGKILCGCLKSAYNPHQAKIGDLALLTKKTPRNK